MAPRSSACQPGSLGCQGSVEPLAVGVKALKHRHASGHALDPVGFVDGKGGWRLRDHRASILFIAQHSALDFALRQMKL